VVLHVSMTGGGLRPLSAENLNTYALHLFIYLTKKTNEQIYIIDLCTQVVEVKYYWQCKQLITERKCATQVLLCEWPSIPGRA
jgi:hypothetical protein